MMRFLIILIPYLVFGQELENRVKQDLEWSSFPGEWVTPQDDVLDVAIIGAGMAGSSAAFALKKMGIHNLILFDENPYGQEGPWVTYAQMKILRSDKCSVGPALNFPSLSFQAWYENTYGILAWKQLAKATPQDWMAYLLWFRAQLALPVQNNTHLLKITPLNDNLFELTFNTGTLYAKKIILATGRTGYGGPKIPPFANSLPFCKHTSEVIDYTQLKNKRVVIIGCGASGFDAAGAALEAQAESVDLLFRRKSVPTQNKLAHFAHAGCEQGYYLLPDEKKWQLTLLANQDGVAPPEEALERVQGYNNFHLHPETAIQTIDVQNDTLMINNTYVADYLILATGYQIATPPLLQDFQILQWKNRVNSSHPFANAPYLGPSYELQSPDPFLKNIYIFNYGAIVSHGLTTTSIDAISVGADRLARGIAADFFLQESELFIKALEAPETAP